MKVMGYIPIAPANLADNDPSFMHRLQLRLSNETRLPCVQDASYGTLSRCKGNVPCQNAPEHIFPKLRFLVRKLGHDTSNGPICNIDSGHEQS